MINLKKLMEAAKIAGLEKELDTILRTYNKDIKFKVGEHYIATGVDRNEENFKSKVRCLKIDGENALFEEYEVLEGVSYGSNDTWSDNIFNPLYSYTPIDKTKDNK